MATPIYINDFMSPRSRHRATMKLKTVFKAVKEDDERHPKINDVTVLDSDVIVVSDMENCSIKAYNMSGVFLQDYFFDMDVDKRNVGRVHGLTQIEKRTVAVTVPGLRGIAFLRLNKINDELIFEQTKPFMATERRYFGIAVLPNETLILGTRDEVSILGFDSHPYGKLFSQYPAARPYHIVVTPFEDIVIADADRICIYCLNKEGQLTLHMHLGKLFLRGITVNDDTIFYCNTRDSFLTTFSVKGDNFFEIYPDGEGLESPVALHYENGQIVVAEERGQIKVFDLDEYHNEKERLKRETELLKWRRMWNCFRDNIGRLIVIPILLHIFLSRFFS